MAAHDAGTKRRTLSRKSNAAFDYETIATPSTLSQRILIVSNRLPIMLNRSERGSWEAKPAAGGLVTALCPILKKRGGLWVGWSGAANVEDTELAPLLYHLVANNNIRMRAVPLSHEEIDGFYRGFSNSIIWPLFHGRLENCNFNTADWHTYCRVNHKFAEILAREATPNDFLWIHDYHLMLLGRELKRLQISNRRGFFLHIPFPPLDLFRKLPWQRQIINGLLDFDLIAFQTDRDRHNFLHCAEALTERFTATTNGPQTAQTHFLAHTAAGDKIWRHVQAATLPISIDYSKMAADAASAPVCDRVAQLRVGLQGRRMILGVDRLDYTKGILHRLRAFRRTLERHTALHGQLILVQHLVPSRENIGDYAQLRRDVEQLVREINGQFSKPGWIPVHYMYHSLSQEDLLAYYRTASIALITPLKDGMNLVAKEYCAAQVDEDGVLILSELAGAAAELQTGALLVNPHNIEGTAECIYQACVMPREERIERMRRLRRTIRNHDVFQWAEAFLTAASLQQSPISKTIQQA